MCSDQKQLRGMLISLGFLVAFIFNPVIPYFLVISDAFKEFLFNLYFKLLSV